LALVLFFDKIIDVLDEFVIVSVKQIFTAVSLLVSVSHSLLDLIFVDVLHEFY